MMNNCEPSVICISEGLAVSQFTIDVGIYYRKLSDAFAQILFYGFKESVMDPLDRRSITWK